MHILKQGPGPLFVFLHGFLGASSDWDGVCAHLPDGWRCVGIDLPGHGAAPFTGDFVEQFPEFGERVHLVGYSMGGRLAMQVAARFPKRVASLTLCSTHPGLREKREERLKSDGVWASMMRGLPVDAFLSEWYDQPIFGGFRPERKLGDREMLARCLMEYSLGRLPVVEVKARAMVGERDEKFRGLWREAVVIRGAGHAVHLENPRDVAEGLRTWIG